MTDSWGDNSFTKTNTQQQTRGVAFFANYDEASHYDGGEGSIVLDYGSHGGNGYYSPTSQLMGELRCFNQHLCIGLTGVWFTGGIKNGVPYVLYRPGTASADEKEPTTKYKYKPPTNMKKARMEKRRDL